MIYCSLQQKLCLHVNIVPICIKSNHYIVKMLIPHVYIVWKKLIYICLNKTKESIFRCWSCIMVLISGNMPFQKIALYIFINIQQCYHIKRITLRMLKLCENSFPYLPLIFIFIMYHYLTKLEKKKRKIITIQKKREKGLKGIVLLSKILHKNLARNIFLFDYLCFSCVDALNLICITLQKWFSWY